MSDIFRKTYRKGIWGDDELNEVVTEIVAISHKPDPEDEDDRKIMKRVGGEQFGDGSDFSVLEKDIEIIMRTPEQPKCKSIKRKPIDFTDRELECVCRAFKGFLESDQWVSANFAKMINKTIAKITTNGMERKNPERIIYPVYNFSEDEGEN